VAREALKIIGGNPHGPKLTDIVFELGLWPQVLINEHSRLRCGRHGGGFLWIVFKSIWSTPFKGAEKCRQRHRGLSTVALSIHNNIWKGKLTKRLIIITKNKNIPAERFFCIVILLK
jgi:hypothetical protein